MAGSPVALHFFVVRLRAEGGKRKAEVYLRQRSDGEDVTANEAVLTNFCFPLGPDSVPAKEYMASEVVLCSRLQQEPSNYWKGDLPSNVKLPAEVLDRQPTPCFPCRSTHSR